MGELSEFQIGQTVELSDGRAATVQYVGNTHFAPGDWVGVELEDASGKNNGEVQGQRYFDCPASHGMFVRPAAVTPMDQTTPKPASRMNGKPNGAVLKSRPSSMVLGGSKRQSILDPVASKRQSINASSPTPASRVSRLTVRVIQGGVSRSWHALTGSSLPANHLQNSLRPPPPLAQLHGLVPRRTLLENLPFLLPNPTVLRWALHPPHHLLHAHLDPPLLGP